MEPSNCPQPPHHQKKNCSFECIIIEMTPAAELCVCVRDWVNWVWQFIRDWQHLARPTVLIYMLWKWRFFQKSNLISCVHKNSQIVGAFFEGPSFARPDWADRSTIPQELHLRKSCLSFKCFAQQIEVLFFSFKVEKLMFGRRQGCWHWSRAVLFPVCHTALRPALISR